jgi:hypothetical protein
VTARLKTDGQTVSTKTVEVDPARIVWTMARLLGAVDQQLRAGDWIVGGSLIHLPIAADHEVTAVLDGLGEVSLKVDPYKPAASRAVSCRRARGPPSTVQDIRRRQSSGEVT